MGKKIEPQFAPENTWLDARLLQQRYTFWADQMSAVGRRTDAAAARRFLKRLASYLASVAEERPAITLSTWDFLVAGARLNDPARRGAHTPDWNTYPEFVA